MPGSLGLLSPHHSRPEAASAGICTNYRFLAHESAKVNASMTAVYVQCRCRNIYRLSAAVQQEIEKLTERASGRLNVFPHPSHWHDRGLLVCNAKCRLTRQHALVDLEVTSNSDIYLLAISVSREPPVTPRPLARERTFGCMGA